jgi:hypothetical protein
MKRFGAIAILLLAGVSAIAQQNPKWDVNGYVKSMQTIAAGESLDDYLFDQLFHHRLNVAFYPGEHWALHGQLRTRMFLGDIVRSFDRYGTIIDDANDDFFDMGFNIVDRHNFVWNTTIDRLYVEFMKGKWELAAGRQRINWGMASFWNPNDLFNAISFTDFDYEEGPGSDAVRISFYPSQKHGLQLAGKAADDWDEAVLALMYKTNWKTYDLQFLAGRFMTDYTIGGGWAGNLKDASFKGEWSIFFPQDWDDGVEFNITAGVDYGFQNGMYLNSGYLYTSQAEDELTALLFTNLLVNAKNLYVFTHSIYSSWLYPATPLLNVGLTVVLSPVENVPLFVNPTLTYSVAENWDLDFVSQMLLGNSNDKYRMVFHGYFFRVKFSY